MTKSIIRPSSTITPKFGQNAEYDTQFRQQLEGYSLTTAQIFYKLPDAPSILQEYIWQEYDVAPKFPKLKEFLDFWNRELDGKVSKVVVANSRMIGPREIPVIDAQLVLH